ncbi:acyl-CoA N-acyltransferase [Xylaria bambusicola]|uniref:acyl-CoA N-acyltransferase n=1 Tax=Xylaria bambusicola TaxID=326684 RepID=UPI00200729AC|nr:acyl-CoA N-acyltransferase [Xylaria bambusicola]KAI0523652.1 acyl-CoA N-acyltransferase [Xylaria bambusicola]
MAAPEVPREETPLVEVINDEESFTDAFESVSEAFGTQAHDAIWEAFNPGWQTPEGRASWVTRMVSRWKSTKTDNKGNPNAVFLKATLPDPSHENPGPHRRRKTVGFAIWVQISAVEGHGDTDLGALGDDVLEALHPGDDREQRFLKQMLQSLFKSRVEFARAKASADPPAVMALDLCATHPAFQRRGVASRLVRWGLEETRRRGLRYAVTEASSMGRFAYASLGFRPQGEDVGYEVDEEFSDREKPPNLFMVYTREGERQD